MEKAATPSSVPAQTDFDQNKPGLSKDNPSSSTNSETSNGDWKKVSYAKKVAPKNDISDKKKKAASPDQGPKSKGLPPYKLVPNPDLSKFSTPPLFVLDSECPFGISNIELCQASIRACGVNCLTACQRFGPLWHLYPIDMEHRARLAGKSVSIRGSSIGFYSKNPSHLVNEFGIAIPATKLTITGISLSITNEDLREALLNLGLGIKPRSELVYEQIFIGKGRPSAWYSGTRFWYIDLPEKPLPMYVDIFSFPCQLHYPEQEEAVQEISSKDMSTQTELLQGYLPVQEYFIENDESQETCPNLASSQSTESSLPAQPTSPAQQVNIMTQNKPLEKPLIPCELANAGSDTLISIYNLAELESKGIDVEQLLEYSNDKSAPDSLSSSEIIAQKNKVEGNKSHLATTTPTGPSRHDQTMQPHVASSCSTDNCPKINEKLPVSMSNDQSTSKSDSMFNLEITKPIEWANIKHITNLDLNGPNCHQSEDCLPVLDSLGNDIENPVDVMSNPNSLFYDNNCPPSNHASISQIPDSLPASPAVAPVVNPTRLQDATMARLSPQAVVCEEMEVDKGECEASATQGWLNGSVQKHTSDKHITIVSPPSPKLVLSESTFQSPIDKKAFNPSSLAFLAEQVVHSIPINKEKLDLVNRTNDVTIVSIPFNSDSSKQDNSQPHCPSPMSSANPLIQTGTPVKVGSAPLAVATTGTRGQGFNLFPPAKLNETHANNMTSNIVSGGNVFNPPSLANLAKAVTYEMHSNPFITTRFSKASEEGAALESRGPFSQAKMTIKLATAEPRGHLSPPFKLDKFQTCNATPNILSEDLIFNPPSLVKLAEAASCGLHGSYPLVITSPNKASEKGADLETRGPYSQSNEFKFGASSVAFKAVTEGSDYNPPSWVKLSKEVACDNQGQTLITNISRTKVAEAAHEVGFAFPIETFKPVDSVQINPPTSNQIVSECQIDRDTEQSHSVESSEKVSCKKELFFNENKTNSASSADNNTPKTHKCNKLKTALKISRKKTPSSQTKLPDAFTRSSRNRLQEGCLTRSRSDSLRRKRLRESPENGIEAKKANMCESEQISPSKDSDPKHSKDSISNEIEQDKA